MKPQHPALIILCLLIFFLSCGKEPTAIVDSSGPAVEAVKPSQRKQVGPNPEKEIQQKLLAYYNDLSSEQIDVSDYFAPVVRKFYSSNNTQREEVGKILQNGFKNIEKRSILLDRSSLDVQKVNNEYVATFEGNVDMTRADKSRVQERFRNRVVFDEAFQILSYEGLQADQKIARAAKNNSSTDGIATCIQAIQAGDYAKINTFIHPEKGFYYITRPGAMDAIYHFQSIESVFTDAYTPWMKESMKDLACNLKKGKVPAYDCDGFASEGCFVENIQNYDRISKLMRALGDAELDEFSATQRNNCKALEALVSHEVVSTSSFMAFYFGEIDGKWYLLSLDAAKYDCSA